MRSLSQSLDSRRPFHQQQTTSTPEVQVPGDKARDAGGATNAKVEEEEGVTEVERYCRKTEEGYSNITLKPEDVNALPELSDTLTKHDGDQIDSHYQNIDTLLVLVSFSFASTT